METSVLILLESQFSSIENTFKILESHGFKVLNLGHSPEHLNGSTTAEINIDREDHPVQKSTPQTDHFFLKDHYRHEKVRFTEILWMKAENSYVEIKTEAKKYLITSDTLGSMLKKLPHVGLLRIHRSYAINPEQVEAIEGNRVVIQQAYIPIGKNYLSEVKAYFPRI